MRERADRALLTIATLFPGLDEFYVFRDIAAAPELLGRSYSADPKQAMTLISILIEEGYLRSQGGGGGISIQGLLAVESMMSQPSLSSQGFVAMSFEDALLDAWLNGFEPAIRLAGFLPMRIDNKEYVGGISDEIMTEIRRSHFVIADYTSQKNGVYFEAGFALGLGLTVIPTCRQDEIKGLHFDIAHINTLAWKEPADLRVSLSRRISAVVGPGPHINSPQ